MVCGAVGALLTMEYMRNSLGCGQSRRFSLGLFSLGMAAGAARSVAVAGGGRKPELQVLSCCAEFVLEIATEQRGLCLLGYSCSPLRYASMVLCGICTFLPWGFLIVPCGHLVNKIFGEDPIVAQKAMLSRVAKEIELSELGAAELANAGKRAE